MTTKPRSDRSRARFSLSRLVLAAGAALIVSVIYQSQVSAERPGPTWPLLSLHVPELNCAVWCSIKVSTAVEAMAGVSAEGLDYQEHVLTVRYDPARSSPEQILGSLRMRGFQVDTIDRSELGTARAPRNDLTAKGARKE